MEKTLAAIISHSIGLFVLTIALFQLKRTRAQVPGKKIYGLPIDTAIKFIYVGMACFILLIAGTLIKGEPV